MAETLFITPATLTETTILGGNIDTDKYTFCVADAQISVIEPLLGTELYDKMVTDFPTFAGLYSTLYTDYIQPITKHAAIASYISIASYTLANGGLFKHSPENAEVVDKEEAQFLSDKYSALAQMYIKRFEKWICENKASIPEYKRSQTDGVNAQDIKLTAGWYFSGRGDAKTEDELWG